MVILSLFACGILGQDFAIKSSEEGLFYDSASFASQDTAGAEHAEDNDSSWQDVARWWKLSADIRMSSEGIEASVYRYVFNEDMVELCQQSIAVEQISQIASQNTEELWFQLSLGEVDQSECSYSRQEEQMQIGIGELISDLAVARDIVELDYEIDSNSDPKGAYFSEEDDIFAFGIAYSLSVDSSVQEWQIRPIYSFRW